MDGLPTCIHQEMKTLSSEPLLERRLFCPIFCPPSCLQYAGLIALQTERTWVFFGGGVVKATHDYFNDLNRISY